MATVSAGRSATRQDMPASHPYSCNTCQVAFRNSDLQKTHMKGDWHRYNLKRRVASLPPISSELFAEKVIQSRASTAAEADRASFERVCNVCQKTYFSENSFKNHVSSQKHRARAAMVAASGAFPRDGDEASSVMSSTFSLGEPIHRAASTADTGSEIVDSDAEEEFSHVVEGLKKATLEEGPSPVKRPANPRLSAARRRKGEQPLAQSETSAANSAAPSTTSAASTPILTPAASRVGEPPHSLKLCLFCNYASPTLELNVTHMERFHGMFVPEKQYLVDPEGLLAMLESRIRDDHECIYCGKLRGDVFAVQTHMRDKSHCKIPYMTIEEQVDIGEFYDFRGTYSDSGDDDDDDDDDDESVVDSRQATAAAHGGNGSRAKLGAKRGVKTAIKTTKAGGNGTSEDDDSEDDEDDDEGGPNEDGWETDSFASSLDSADLTAVPAENHYHQYERLDKHPHHSQTDPRSHHQADGWHSHAHKHNHAVFYDEYELHLPSGRSVGHRSLNRYFRQNLRHYPSVAERDKQRRLAIEAGVAPEDLIYDDSSADSDGGSEDTRTAGNSDNDNANHAQVARLTAARAMVARPTPRNVRGMEGVTDARRAGMQKRERRLMTQKNVAENKYQIRHSHKVLGQGFRFAGH